MVRDRPDSSYDVVARAFKWTVPDAKAELAQVHLSNLPENLAFFSGQIDEAGSFSGIYQSAVLAYGSDLIRNPLDASRFADTQHLVALDKSGLFKEQKIAIAPIRLSTGGATLETNPLLSKDIRFMFEPNKADLDMSEPREHQESRGDQEAARRSAPVRRSCCAVTSTTRRSRSSASSDGEAIVQHAALRAMQLSKDRAGGDPPPAHREVPDRSEAPRRRRPRLGRAARHGLQPEPARRSAVVHD